IKFRIDDPHSVLKQNKMTGKDIVNLCGGIPLKGKHIGTNLFLNQLVTARAHGFEKLHTIAIAPSKYDDEGTAWYGYYFWANLGFQNMEPDEYRAWAAELQ